MASAVLPAFRMPTCFGSGPGSAPAVAAAAAASSAPVAGSDTASSATVAGPELRVKKVYGYIESQHSYSVPAALIDFFAAGDEFFKPAKYVANLVGEILARSGKLKSAEEARAVSREFGAAGTYVKGLAGTVFCLGSALNHLGKALQGGEKWARELLKATKSFCDAAYCSEASVTILGGDKVNLLGQKIVGLVSMFGSLVSPFLGLIEDALKMRDVHQMTYLNPDGECLITDRRIKTECDAIKGSLTTQAWTSIAKNICNLAMSIIVVLGILASVTMAPSVAIIVMSVLSIMGLIFKAASHVSAANAKFHQANAYIMDQKNMAAPQAPRASQSGSVADLGAGASSRRPSEGPLASPADSGSSGAPAAHSPGSAVGGDGSQ